MRYYAIKNSDCKEVLGNYPQVTLRNVSPGKVSMKKQAQPKYELTLNPNANITNKLVSNNRNYGMIIDDKFKEVLSNFRLPEHEFYPVKVYDKGKVLEYYCFCTNDHFWELVDTKNSIALTVDSKNPNLIVNKTPIISKKQIEYENKDMIKLGKKPLVIGSIAIHTNAYDFYNIDCLNVGSVISEPLQEALIKAKLTGFELHPYPQLSVQG